ncbi:cell envelope integrity protein TolA [Hydrogenovibrio marinus]|uniref:Protein TolA n=1 Tax=Hydrogenovibrio marinus TaxID=28885 RepID=A0A066ZM47_HYDMR|nr:cell envelope integrity protein TolA [Hydrogenovibrio marinus]KDN94893.1 hypothetical protein EI16_00830 [Hydrogenovibrio marinus]BBN59357.1 hypothetical protein HVMH_0951 [Hydrogenovibrio marinus]
MIRFISRHPVAFALAILLHIIILLGLSYQNFMTPDDNTIKVTLTSPDENAVDQKNTVEKMQPMKTTLLDAKTVQAALDKVKQQEADKKRQQQELAAQTKEEKRRIALLQQQKDAERKKIEQAKLQAEAEKRKAEEAAKLAEIQKQKVEAEKQRAIAEAEKADKAKQQAMLAEKQRQEAAKLVAQAESQKAALQEQIKKHSEEKKLLEQEALKARLQKEQEEQEAQIQQQIAAEESKKREQAKAKELQNLKEVYVNSIASNVRQKWRTAARISDKAECVISITQTPNGMVSSVKVDHCNQFANAQFRKDAESAVLRSQPLPQPPVKEVFDRNIQFKFKP